MDQGFWSDRNLIAASAVAIVVLLWTQEFAFACLGAALTLALIFAAGRGWLTTAVSGCAPLAFRFAAWLANLLRASKARPARPYDLLVGYDPLTGAAIVENLADLGHIGVYGTTRYGKTTWLHSLIHDLIGSHTANELKLVISDPKRVDYALYGALPHLLMPIARDQQETGFIIDRLIAEMDRRVALFDPLANKSLCNNLDRYTELTGERLPRVVAIFDELADVIPPGSELEANLIRLAKLGLAYGIHLICATQRPSSKVVTGEIKSQMASKFVTWMPSAREYGVVSELPKEMYQDMPRLPGRFMSYTASGWRFVQGRRVPDRQLEKLAARRSSGRRRVWQHETAADNGQETTEAARPEWDGNDNDKVRFVLNLGAELGRRPSINETAARYKVSRPTAIKYLRMAYDEQ